MKTNVYINESEVVHSGVYIVHPNEPIVLKLRDDENDGIDLSFTAQKVDEEQLPDKRITVDVVDKKINFNVKFSSKHMRFGSFATYKEIFMDESTNTSYHLTFLFDKPLTDKALTFNVTIIKKKSDGTM